MSELPFDHPLLLKEEKEVSGSNIVITHSRIRGPPPFSCRTAIIAFPSSNGFTSHALSRPAEKDPKLSGIIVRWQRYNKEELGYEITSPGSKLPSLPKNRSDTKTGFQQMTMVKTSLLQHVCKDRIAKVLGLKMWVCVSNNFDVKRVIAGRVILAERRKRLEAETKEEKLASFPRGEEEVEQARKLFQEEETRSHHTKQPTRTRNNHGKITRQQANRDKKQPREGQQAADRPGQKHPREDQQAEANNTGNSHGKTNSSIPKEQPRGRATGSNTWEENSHGKQPRRAKKSDCIKNTTDKFDWNIKFSRNSSEAAETLSSSGIGPKSAQWNFNIVESAQTIENTIKYRPNHPSCPLALDPMARMGIHGRLTGSCPSPFIFGWLI
ncbi:hypothetical protein M5K25_022782 [Dendrobium thyrsiflorum]|uniref:Uncharacterized protein n=1 Tax=Dendrobium thyrsiflorum TaxID=117978 RepID=A0ABD0U6T1_DENTH